MLHQALCIISKPLVNSNWSYSPEMPTSSQNPQFFVSCDLEFWQMTLNNNTAPLLCYVKLCASFSSHQWIQTGVTVRKRPIWVKIDIFLSLVTLKFDGWPWKTVGYLFYAHMKLCASFQRHIMWIQTGVTVWKWLNWVLTSVTLTSVTLTFCMGITFVNGNHACQFYDMMTGRLSKRCDGHTDGTIHRAAWSQLKMQFSILF